MMKRCAIGLALLAAGSMACGGSDDGGSGDDAACEGAKCDDPLADSFEARNVCVGVRGNGELIFAHFASLARIVEHYGLVTGYSGGSSASITGFILESVQLNPAVESCGDAVCSPSEQAARAAFLLKSLQGYVQVLAGTDEAMAIQQLIPLSQRVQDEGLAAVAAKDVEAARLALLDILTSPELGDLINPEVLTLLLESEDPTYHVRDIIDALTGFGSFDADDPKILVRPGFIDFEAFGRKIARIANFYAGYGPWDEAAVGEMLDACAVPSRGLSWPEAAALPAGDTTCGQMYAQIVTTYREALVADEDNFLSRADDEVGAWIPSLISTSVITGDGVAAWEASRAQYLSGMDPQLDVDFDDVRFGYWGLDVDLDAVGRNDRGYDDLKTDKFMALGEASWGHALSYSPAEPGLTRALELPDGNVSAGGWSDLHPSLVLHNLGCEKVVYVSRAGEDSSFSQGVATLLGMTAEDQRALYDHTADSSYDRSIAAADAVWCTDWNNQSATDLQGVFDDAYHAPMVTSDPVFSDGEAVYENVRPDLDVVGCAPRAGAAAE